MSQPNGEACSAPSYFNELLRLLVEEHENEIFMLRSEIEHLRSKLPGTAQPSECEADENEDILQVYTADSVDSLILRQYPLGHGGTGDNERNENKRHTVGTNPDVALHNCFDDDGFPGRQHVILDVAQTLSSLLDRYNVQSRSVRRLEEWIVWWFSLKEPDRSSWLARVTDSNRFSMLCMTVIFFNAVFIWYEADTEMNRAFSKEENKVMYADSPPVLAIDTAFAMFYVVELTMRLLVHRMYFYVADDWRWNTMDTIVVVFSIVDVTVRYVENTDASGALNLTYLRLLRAVKIVKVFRVMRGIRFVQELRLMFESLASSTVQLFWCSIMVAFVYYLFALVYVQALSGYVSDQWQNLDKDQLALIQTHFRNVAKAIVSNFQATSGGVDWREPYELVEKSGTGFGLVYVGFICFFVIAAWNIVTSFFVEKTFSLAMPNYDALIEQKRRQDLQNAHELTELIQSTIDENQDGFITLDEFSRHISNPKVREFFRVRGLDLKDIQAFFRMTKQSEEGDAVDIKTLVRSALRLKGNASSLDLQTMHFDIKYMYIKQSERLKHIEKLVEEMSEGRPRPPAYGRASSMKSLLSASSGERKDARIRRQKTRAPADGPDMRQVAL